MQIQIPHNDSYSTLRLTVSTPRGVLNMDLDNSHKTTAVQMPEGVDESDVEVIGRYLGGDGQPTGAVLLLKERVRKVEAKKAEPKVETKVETKVEKKVTPVEKPAAEEKAEIKADVE